jgi:hypothetical protein
MSVCSLQPAFPAVPPRFDIDNASMRIKDARDVVGHATFSILLISISTS